MAVAKKQKPRSTGHHRKRHGHHQRRNTHFMKAYWPYLPIAFVIGIGMLANSLWLKPDVLSYATNMTSGGLLSSTNSERSKNGLSALSINSKLNQAAQAKAQDMVNRDYWSHNTPDGDQPWVFINKTGYQYVSAGENLAYGFSTSEKAVMGWMNSSGHRANILNTGYSEVGFGIANSPNFQGKGEQTVVVAMYAKPASPAPVASSKPKTPETKPESPAPRQVEQKEPEDEKEDEEPIAVGTTDTQEKADTITVSATVPGDTKIARVQIATSGAAPWSMFAASMLAVGLLLLFIARHGLAWHRVVVRGESFILKHKVLDVVVVSGIVIAAILSQTAGIIL